MAMIAEILNETSSLPHRQLRKDRREWLERWYPFTAAQAAQKFQSWQDIHPDLFTAAQAAQKCGGWRRSRRRKFTAAQAAQKLGLSSSHSLLTFTAAQAAQKVKERKDD